MPHPEWNVPPILDRFRLDGKVALVTGGGQAIGRAYAHALGEAGAKVAVVDVVTERAEVVAVDDLVNTPEGQEVMPRWMSLTPMGRMAEVTDLQGAIVYFAAPASDFVTGHDLVVDGGYAIW